MTVILVAAAASALRKNPHGISRELKRTSGTQFSSALPGNVRILKIFGMMSIHLASKLDLQNATLDGKSVVLLWVDLTKALDTIWGLFFGQAAY